MGESCFGIITPRNDGERHITVRSKSLFSCPVQDIKQRKAREIACGVGQPYSMWIVVFRWCSDVTPP